MIYELKTGVLRREEGGESLARIKGGLGGPARQILTPGGTVLLRTDILRLEAPRGREGDLRYTRYRMYGADGGVYAEGAPGYAPEEDPERVGWPVCRMPRADRIALTAGEARYTLYMDSGSLYRMEEEGAGCRMRMVHRGVAGGWRLECEPALPACFLCGLFVFCRYLEGENQFLVV
ncbi:MAG TPA: hypothetical protein H9764_10800 [Candidatus Flavonifractor merdavium]|nr:hypothetical protein [Candidatus Flavonifractor merdavium]